INIHDVAFSVNPPTWVISGAGLGDSSICAYGVNPTINLNEANLPAEVEITSGFSATDGVQLYWSKNNPENSTLPTGIDSLLLNVGFYGVHRTNLSGVYNFEID